MKTIRDILDHFDTVFWIVLVFGTSLASFLKKRAQQRAAEEARRGGVPPRPSGAAVPARQSVPPSAPPPPPPPVPGTKHRSSVATTFVEEGSSGFRPGLLDHLEHPGRFKQTGNLRATGPAVLSRKHAWRPHCSWQEAVILHEVLGPPRAFSESQLPGLLS